MSTVLTRLRRLLHRTPPARVAAHHPLPIVDPTGLATEAWEKAWPLPARHTHRDPTTGRYTRREQ